MIERHTYECEICGKIFEDEEECLGHEWEHGASVAKGHLFLCDLNGKEVAIEKGVLDSVFYVKWTSNAAIQFFIDWMKEECGWAGNLSRWEDASEGQLYYEHDEWCDLADYETAYRNTRRIFDSMG